MAAATVSSKNNSRAQSFYVPTPRLENIFKKGTVNFSKEFYSYVLFWWHFPLIFHFGNTKKLWIQLSVSNCILCESAVRWQVYLLKTQ